MDILGEWGEGESHLQQQRYFHLVMCFINMLVILGFSFVRTVPYRSALDRTNLPC